MTVNALFAFPTWRAMATYSGAWGITAFPVTNAGILPLARLARSPGVADANLVMSWALDKPRPTQVVTMVAHSGSLSASGRVTLWGEVGHSTILARSAWVPLFPSVYPSSVLHWADENFWMGRYTSQQYGMQQWCYPFIFDSVFECQYGTLEVSDIGNSAGFLDLRMLDVASGHVMGRNFSNATEYGVDARAVVQQADGGTLYVRERNKPRQWALDFPYLDRDEARFIMDMKKLLGQSTPVVFVPNADDATNYLRDTGLYFLKDLPNQKFAEKMLDSVQVNLYEAV